MTPTLFRELTLGAQLATVILIGLVLLLTLWVAIDLGPVLVRESWRWMRENIGDKRASARARRQHQEFGPLITEEKSRAVFNAVASTGGPCRVLPGPTPRRRTMNIEIWP